VTVNELVKIVHERIDLHPDRRDPSAGKPGKIPLELIEVQTGAIWRGRYHPNRGRLSPILIGRRESPGRLPESFWPCSRAHGRRIRVIF